MALAVIGASLPSACGSAVALQEDPLDPQVQRYGYAPQPNPSITLQPDVVIVQGGARAIKSAGDDGLTWVIDARAAGADRVAVGSVMFVTSRAMGRVLRMERRGDDLGVVLGPVDLTDVIRHGTLRLEQKLDADAIIFQKTADAARLARLPEERYSLTGALRLSRASFVTQPADPVATKGSLQVKLGEFDVEPYIKHKAQAPKDVMGFGVKVSRGIRWVDEKKGSFSAHGGGFQGTAGLKFGADVSIYGREITVRSTIPIRDGQVEHGASFVIDGIEEVSLGLIAGADRGRPDNVKVRGEIPVEIFMQFPPSPATWVPMVLQIKHKLFVELVFSSRNSTLLGHGRYKVAGSIGYQNGSLAIPAFSVLQPMIDSVTGVTLGPAVIVVGSETRLFWGVGTRAFSTGVYGKLAIGASISQGSLLGAALLLCRGVTLKIDAGYGIGTVAVSEVNELLSKLLGKEIKTDIELIETMHPVVDGRTFRPDTKVCRWAQ